ncbi:MAG TPA: fasciclin domain-containing protein [Pyrinomonadaceae bacterium]|jgi:uncharacterized surface protein with fasciclin (FAS1) repeats|nr:fasciclin domain-containing protein [Pyrinomonadaceae bacterium]
MTDRLNLIETIAKDQKFSTFSRLLDSSGAKDIFNGEGDFTVLAPTNDAFAKIADPQMTELLSEAGKAKLKNLLAFHILPGKLMSGNIAAKASAKTVMGPEVNFTDINGIRVNGSAIQARNIEASNGVVHAIETVLAPPAAVAAAATAAPEAVVAGTPVPPVAVAATTAPLL